MLRFKVAQIPSRSAVSQFNTNSDSIISADWSICCCTDYIGILTMLFRFLHYLVMAKLATSSLRVNGEEILLSVKFIEKLIF